MSSVIRIQSMKHNAPFQLECFLQGLTRIAQVDWIQQTTVNFFALRNGIGRDVLQAFTLWEEYCINETVPLFLEGELDSFTDMRLDLPKAPDFLILSKSGQSRGLIFNNNKVIMEHMNRQMKACGILILKHFLIIHLLEDPLWTLKSYIKKVFFWTIRRLL